MINLDSVLKSRDTTLLMKIRTVKAMVFPKVTYCCERWTVKPKIDAFELWCWRRFLRVPWTGSISNQSMLREINPEYSLEELMLELKFQYFGHLMWTDDSLEVLDVGKDRGQKEKKASEDEIAGRHHWCNGHELGQTPGDGEGQGGLVCCSSWDHKETQLGDWTTRTVQLQRLSPRPRARDRESKLEGLKTSI